MNSNKNLIFVFIQPTDNVIDLYFQKFTQYLKSNGYFSNVIPIRKLNELNTSSTFFYNRVFICHNPTIIDFLKSYQIRGTDTVVQFLSETENLTCHPKKWCWRYYQNIIYLERLYPNVYGIDMSFDNGLYKIKDRLRSKSNKIFQICGALTPDNNTISFYPKRIETYFKFDVGIIHNTECSLYKKSVELLQQSFGKKFTIIKGNTTSKIRKCKLIIVLGSDIDAIEKRYPDTFYQSILFNVPIVSNIYAYPFTEEMSEAFFETKDKLLPVVSHVLCNLPKFELICEQMIYKIAGEFNLSNQIIRFANWLSPQLDKTIYATDNLNVKVNNFKQSFIMSSPTGSLRDVFDKIYIINLKKDVKRLARVKTMMKENNIVGYEIFEAVDGREHKDLISNIQLNVIDNGGYESDHNFIRNVGELGCLLSHLAIIQEAKTKNYNSVLIFEDDVILTTNFLTKFIGNYVELNKPWDMLYLGCSKVDFFVNKVNISRGFSTIEYCTGTFAYAVKKNAYDIIINEISKLVKPIDICYAKDITPNIKAIVADPYLAISDTTVSNIRDGMDLQTAAKTYNWELGHFPVQKFYTPKRIKPSAPVFLCPPNTDLHNSSSDELISDIEVDDEIHIKWNKFVVVVPVFNSGEWIEKCVMSIINQKYNVNKVKICIVDDCSTDQNHIDKLKKIEKTYPNRIKIIYKTVNEGGLKAIIDAFATVKPNNEDIILQVDGDDWLYHDNVFKIINKAYQDRTQLTYGSYKIHYPNNKLHNTRGICADCAGYVRIYKSYRKHKWIFSHLRTFKYKLWKKIKHCDLKDDNEQYWRVSWDMAYMFPLLELSNGLFKYINDILYVYNMHNPLCDFKLRKNEQEYVELCIRQMS